MTSELFCEDMYVKYMNMHDSTVTASITVEY